MQLISCSGLLALCACDAPTDENTASQSTEHSADLRYVAPATSTEIPAAGATIHIPENETEHAIAIRRLSDFPRTDALYPEQVKLLCNQYLQRYPNHTQSCQVAMQCFIDAVLQQPERFSGRDFDRAYEFCQYSADAAAQSALTLYLADLELCDYRKSAEEQAATLQRVRDYIDTAVATQDISKLAHALYIAAKYTDGSPRREYVTHYFAQADTLNSPFRIPMMKLGQLPPQQLLPLVVQEAESGRNTEQLLPFISQLSTNDIYAQQLRANKATEAILLTQLLEKALNTTSPNDAEVLQLANQIQALPISKQSAFIQLTLARYLQSRGDEGVQQAIDYCRNIASGNNAYRTEAALLLANLLANTEGGADEATQIYNTLASEPESATVIAALQGLLALQEKTQQNNTALTTTHALLQVVQDSEMRADIIFRRAALAEKTGNLTEAINLYSQLESDYCGTPDVALPACKKMLQLLISRNFPQKTDEEKGTYTPSDKWYAWVRGRDFVKAWQRNTEALTTLPPDQKTLFDEIRKIVDDLGIDYNVLTEERDKHLHFRAH